MSEWHPAKKEDVELSEDGKEIYVCVTHNHNGNVWSHIPIEIIRAVLPSPWREVREFLENTRMSHHYCDDSWYSCPKHPDGCANEELTECNCGADEYNKKLDEILKLLPAPPAGEE